MAKKGARSSGGGKARAKTRSQSAARHAPPTPAHRCGKTHVSSDIARRLKELGLVR
jgi:hypothetical protein